MLKFLRSFSTQRLKALRVVLVLGVGWLQIFQVFMGTPGSAESVPCASVSTFVRVTSSGDRIEGALYIPIGQNAEQPPPYPIYIYSHGFSRDYGRYVANAEALACAGILTYTPNTVPVDQLNAEKSRQVENLIDHVSWLRAKVSDPQDVLFGVGDGSRVVLGGHSAGAALSLEAVVKLQDQGMDIAGLVLLDIVPDDATLKAATRLRSLPVLSVRSRPSSCNAFGSGRNAEKAIPFQITSILIPWTTHCDPEWPTDVLCRVLCGGGSEAGRAAFRDKTKDFFLQTLF